MTRTQRLIRIATIIACLATLAFLIVGAVFHWAWAGFDKPLYDWMQLLIIPIVLALIAVWFNRIDKKNELSIAQKRADDERALAIDNQQETALQGYLDRMQELLLHEKLRESKPGDEVRNVARVRTLTMFYQVNMRRTNYMLSFLRESGLVSTDANQSIVTFNNADLRNVDLHEIALYNLDLSKANFHLANLNGANLNGANLSDAILIEVNLSDASLSKANLSEATLLFADLKEATLSEADLSKANFYKADLYGAALSETDLSGANLRGADLRRADFSGANLSGANLRETNLREADFSGANLSGAKIDQPSLITATLTKEQIADMQIVFP